MIRTCHKCKKTEPEAKFGKKPKDRKALTCKDCKWGAHLWRKYKITVEEYNRLLKKQKGLCWICKQKETKIQHGNVQKLCTDHNHTTEKVRGLLCDRCNKLIRIVDENIKLVKKLCPRICLYLKTFQDMEVG